MVKTKKDFCTYGKKKQKKQQIKITPNVLLNVNVTNVNVTNNFYFNNTPSSGDEFDKLLKGPSFQPYANFSSERHYFFERQDSARFYNSDVTPTTFSSSSSVGLFKDLSDIYSNFGSPISKGKKKNPLKKTVFKKVCKKKVKKVSLSRKIKYPTTAKCSTPTHPNLTKKDYWIGLVSPIMPVMNSDMFEDENKENKTSDKCVPKISSDISLLVAGLDRLGLVTPTTKLKDKTTPKKEFHLATPSEINIRNNQFYHSTKFKKNFRQTTDFELNKHDGAINAGVRRRISVNEFCQGYINCEKIANESNTETSNENLDKNSTYTLQVDSSKITCRHPRSSKKDIYLKSLPLPTSLDITESGQSPFKEFDCSKHAPVNLINQFRTSTSKLDSEISERNSNNKNQENKELMHQLLSPEEHYANYEQTKRQEITSVTNISKNGQESGAVQTIHSTTEKNLRGIETSSMIKQNLFSKEQDLTYCKLSLRPGKGWRRSFLEKKKSDIYRASVGPEILAKLAKEANLSCTRFSHVNNSKSFMNLNDESFLKRVSIRPRTTVRRHDLFHEHSENSSQLPMQQSCESTFKTSRGRFGDTSLKNNFSTMIFDRRTMDGNALKKLLTAQEFRNKISMGNIAEESTEDFFDNSQDFTERDSQSPEQKESKFDENLIQQVTSHQCINEIDETPPIMKDNSNIWSTVSKRRQPSQNREYFSKSFESPEISSITSFRNSDSIECQESPLCKSLNQSTDGVFYGDNSFNDLAPISGKEGFLFRCNVDSPMFFEDIFTEELLENCTKIGEGVYGEVFMLDKPERRTVVKIIPIEGNQDINGASQKTFDEVLSELITTEELSLLRENKVSTTDGFCHLKHKLYLQGSYPSQLLDLWHEFDKKHKSYNQCPDILGPNNCFLTLELEHAGKPVEDFLFRSAQQAYSLFLQVVFSLAVAEDVLFFEHRDLHIGNILVKEIDEDYISFRIQHTTFKVPSYGVKATIIDFTLSRITFLGSTIYYDMAKDPELFTSTGDYQFEIYRLMKNDLDDCWETHQPKTNIRWLHYLLDKLVVKKYKYPKTKAHKAHLKKLGQYKTWVQNFSSALDYAKYFLDVFPETIELIIKD